MRNKARMVSTGVLVSSEKTRADFFLLKLSKEQFSCNHAGEGAKSQDEWEVKKEVGVQLTML